VTKLARQIAAGLVGAGLALAACVGVTSPQQSTGVRPSACQSTRGATQATPSASSRATPEHTYPPNPFKRGPSLDPATTHLSDIRYLTIGPDGNLYTLSSMLSTCDSHPRVSITSPSGTSIRSWGDQGSGQGEFDLICEDDVCGGIAVSPHGRVYVADANNHRIEVFLPTGGFAGQFGAYGTGAGQFLQPGPIVFDHRFNLYVGDYTQRGITKFYDTGAEGQPEDWLVWHVGGYGAEDPELRSLCCDLAVDSHDRLFVADDLGGRIVVFDRDGNTAAVFEGESSPDPFTPCSIALDGNDNVYVFDCFTQSTQVFDPHFRLLGGWYPGPGTFPNVRDIVFGPEGQLYVFTRGGDTISTLEVNLPGR
jgi:hypothetical protein